MWIGSKVQHFSRPRRRVILRASAYGGRECPDELERNIAPWVGIDSAIPIGFQTPSTWGGLWRGGGETPQKTYYHPSKHRENLRRYDMEASGSAIEMKFHLPFFVCKLSAVALERTKTLSSSVRTALSQNVEDMTSLYHQCRGKACPLAMPVWALGEAMMD